MEDNHSRLLATLDESFVGRLYHQHALQLMSYVRRHVQSREDAEDIVLEVFLAILQQQGRVHWPAEKQLAWLLRVASNKIADYHRRAGRRSTISLDETAAVPEDDRQSPDQQALRAEEERLLRERLGQLPESYQMILQLRFAHGLRATEIAARLHKSPGAVRMVLARALNTLREKYTGR